MALRWKKDYLKDLSNQYMRNGKDRTYRLSILVFAANNTMLRYGMFNIHLKNGGSIDNFQSSPHLSYKFYHQPTTQRWYNINSKIPRSSFYRVLNNLVDNGYMLKIFHYNSKTPRFFISLKGLLFLIGAKNNG